MAVPIRNEEGLKPGIPEMLFEEKFAVAGFGGRASNYDVSLDGSRFVIVRDKNPVTPTSIHYVVNWPEAFGLSSDN